MNLRVKSVNGYLEFTGRTYFFSGKTSQETLDDEDDEEEDDNNSSNNETSDSDEAMQVTIWRIIPAR